MRYTELLLYRNFKHEDILKNISMLAAVQNIDENLSDYRKTLYETAGELTTLSENHGYNGNLWHTYLTYLIANNENAYSTACEIRGKVLGSINDVALHDFEIFKELFDYDIEELDRKFGVKCFVNLKNYSCAGRDSKMFNKRIRDRICELAGQLSEAESTSDFSDRVTLFYKEFGVGKFGLHKAFRVEHDDEGVKIVPITNIAHVHLDDLVGYEIPKKKLIDNTEAFVNARPSNNCLLFGDAGTGKSSCIKGILNEYYDRGLRIIEIYKHQFRDLNDVIAMIKNRNYRFIIYMDDLSFEDFEIEYKYLKAVIEGGLEKKPDNILIYATSNRRHLVREKNSDKADRDDDLHTNDTVQEKLSLVYRFGVSIFFSRPGKKEFDNIVVKLAERYNIDMSREELLAEANKWELSHGGMSGRTAQQFIDYLRGKEDINQD